MSKVISVHEYVLRPGADERRFEAALRRARERGLPRLPGLVEVHFVKGIRGSRRGGYAAIWVYESRQAWERVWGPPERPPAKDDHPQTWKVWEDEVLAPFLDRDPDTITHTVYQEW